jgi:hypothetical protein
LLLCLVERTSATHAQTSARRGSTTAQPKMQPFLIRMKLLRLLLLLGLGCPASRWLASLRESMMRATSVLGALQRQADGESQAYQSF